ncbi:DUF916 and DUF3324 domain-containing protein [Vagococcus hydrophili]|uniref:DUF916 and DUF3324 domain-containing protein n=1 Tax=Vagococcus hydrophili TaxID=2714947 RepID=A0A6G8ARD6_9ENTE|nr:DUF916 and DUF3324 domain-containing protein [Vagococcus hydrophili]QIL47502.1 DUF916 and DUF3324 domain-containing protein [Vagococcus hydrophili]
MKTNNKKIRIILVMILWLCSVVGFNQVQADETHNENSFKYKVIFPDNQMEENIGYYHLKMKPDQEQIVQIEMTNPGTKKTAVGISLNGTKTNANGVIEYGDTSIKNDTSVKFDFTDIVSAPKKVELNPGETKTLEIKIKMPKTSFNGVVTGGVQMIQEGQNKVENKGGSMVLNEYAYVVGMVLQESDEKVTPKLKLNSVKAGQSNYKNMVYVNYSNIEAAYVDNMTTEVQITKKGSDAVIYERKQAKMRMAPNSFISFPVGMNGEKMEPGDYTATILVTADNGIKEKWTKDFKISKDEADKFNERDVGLEQNKGINWLFIGLIVVGFFAVVLIVVMIMTISRKNKQKKAKKKGSKRRK